jgi:hypothetical protein
MHRGATRAVEMLWGNIKGQELANPSNSHLPSSTTPAFLFDLIVAVLCEIQ